MSQIEYMHFRPKQRNLNGGATIAIMPVEGTIHALVALSRCGPQDIFNKKIGRSISAGRIRAYLEGRVGMDKYVRVLAIPDPMFLKKTVAECMADEIEEAGME